MNWPLSILLTNVAATLFMAGLIWMRQVVHYPLFDEIGEQNYVRYQERHQASITLSLASPVQLDSNSRKDRSRRHCDLEPFLRSEKMNISLA